MRKKIFLSLLFLLPSLCLFAQMPPDNLYPTPQRLFHIARSANKNLVCYDINLPEGKLDLKNPMKVYWVNREEHPGETNGLNYIQRKFAYGYKVKSANDQACVCTLTAYDQRPLTIMRQQSKYVCLIKINHQTAILHSLYVKAHPKNPLKVEYVELEGTSLATKRAVKERIRNN